LNAIGKAEPVQVANAVEALVDSLYEYVRTADWREAEGEAEKRQRLVNKAEDKYSDKDHRLKREVVLIDDLGVLIGGGTLSDSLLNQLRGQHAKLEAELQRIEAEKKRQREEHPDREPAVDRSPLEKMEYRGVAKDLGEFLNSGKRSDALIGAFKQSRADAVVHRDRLAKDLVELKEDLKLETPKLESAKAELADMKRTLDSGLDKLYASDGDARGLWGDGKDDADSRLKGAIRASDSKADKEVLSAVRKALGDNLFDRDFGSAIDDWKKAAVARNGPHGPEFDLDVLQKRAENVRMTAVEYLVRIDIIFGRARTDEEGSPRKLKRDVDAAL
jgi:uncharacterized phage infection (PIP) family protein YhgE